MNTYPIKKGVRISISISDGDVGRVEMSEFPWNGTNEEIVKAMQHMVPILYDAAVRNLRTDKHK